jgi:hypothetical protein
VQGPGHRIPYPLSEAERARETLRFGILAFRWGALAWMTSLAVTTRDPFLRPVLAWASLGAAIAWTAWLTVRVRDETRGRHAFDLVLAASLIVVSDLVVGDRQVLGGRPFFATAYPVAAALSWGAAFGLGGGLFAGAVLGGALAVSRTLNGVPFELLTAAQIAGMVNGAIAYLLAGGAVGFSCWPQSRSSASTRGAAVVGRRWEASRSGHAIAEDLSPAFHSISLVTSSSR